MRELERVVAMEREMEREIPSRGRSLGRAYGEAGRVGECGGGCCIRRVRCWAGESGGLWSAGFKRERESTRAISPSCVKPFPEVGSVW